MSEEQMPDIEEIKEKIEIPIEEDDIAGLKAEEKSNGPDVVEEFKKLGRQFAETIEAAWNSEERIRVETEVREGVNSFVDEVDKVFREAKDSATAEKVKGEAAEAKTRVENSDIGEKARDGIVLGLTWLSEEFGKLADQFTPVPTEKGPEDIAGDVVEEEPVVEKAPESE
jgi:hypothetical protein